MDFFNTLKLEMVKLIQERNIGNAPVHITVRTLTPQEAIGNPGHDDYPLVKGRERMMEAEFDGAKGQAFTDRFGAFEGALQAVADMALENSYRRAVFIATLNAVMRRFELCDRTVHCRDDEPPQCADELVKFMESRYGNPKIAMVGLQPRMLERLSKGFEVRVSDLDEDNIGTKKFGVLVEGLEATVRNVDWCDLVFATGSALCNNTLESLFQQKPVLVFGVTVAGPAALLKLDRFCPMGH